MSKRVIIVGLLASLVLVLLSPYASSHPDGLERVAENLGFIDRAQEAPYELLPDYTVPGVEIEAFSTILAGLIGAAMVFQVMVVFATLLQRSNDSKPRSQAG